MGQSLFKQLKAEGLDVEYFETMDEAGDQFHHYRDCQQGIQSTVPDSSK